MKKVGIVACSNGQKKEYEKQNIELVEFLKSHSKEVVSSTCIYERNGIAPGTIKERASELMRLFADQDIEEIYDISGGDIANQILDEIDYDVIKNSKAIFWGYSDLTTIINAIYTMTNKPSVLYQIKNTVWSEYSTIQKQRYTDRTNLFNPKFEFINGDMIEGIVVGGNIRCFLKLAGTKYFPDLEGKVLLLEALGGDVPKVCTYLAQLKQLGAFEKINGILVGTFTTLENNGIDVCQLIQEYSNDLPIAKTFEIGHGNDAKAIMIGKQITLHKE